MGPHNCINVHILVSIYTSTLTNGSLLPSGNLLSSHVLETSSPRLMQRFHWNKSVFASVGLLVDRWGCVHGGKILKWILVCVCLYLLSQCSFALDMGWFNPTKSTRVRCMTTWIYLLVNDTRVLLIFYL